MSDDGFKPDVQSVFGGLCTYVKRAQLATGMSPACNDVEFRPGVVQSRPGYSLRTVKDRAFNAIEEFVSPDAVRHLMLLDNDGNFIDSTAPDVNTAVVQTIGAELSMRGVTMYGRFFFTTFYLDPSASDPDFPVPVDDPWQYDTAAATPISGVGLYAPTAFPAVFATAAAGTISAGEHMFFYLYEDQYGTWSGPSPVTIVKFDGTKQAQLSAGNGLNAIAPAEVTRILFFATVAGGKDFYNLPVLTYNTPHGAGSGILYADFTDTDLLASGIPFDAFRTQVRAPISTGIGSYAERLVCFGTYSVFEPYVAVSLAEAEPLYGTSYWTAGASITNFDGTKINDGIKTVLCATFSTDATLQTNNWIKFDAGSNQTLRVGRVKIWDTAGTTDLFLTHVFDIQYSDDDIVYATAKAWVVESVSGATYATNGPALYPYGAHRYWRIIVNPSFAFVPAGTQNISEIELLPTTWGEVLGPVDQDFSMIDWNLITLHSGSSPWEIVGGIAGGVFVDTGGSILAAGATYGAQGNVFQIAGDGVTLTRGDWKQWFAVAHRSSFQDTQYYIPPGTRPGLLLRVNNFSASSKAGLRVTLTGAVTGTVYVNGVLNSPFTGTLPALSLSAGWYTYRFDGIADLLPTDDTLIIEIKGGDGVQIMVLAGKVLIDYFRIYDSRRAFDGDTLWFSEYGQPALFDRVKSPLPISSGDGDQLRGVFEQSGNYYAVKENSVWVTSDNGGDPNTWAVDNVTLEMGTPSYSGVALGPDFIIIAHSTGVYRFTGGRPTKISQEIENLWRETLDPQHAFRVWISVDSNEQVVWIGVPVVGGEGYAVCHKIFKCDYSEGWESAVGNGGVGRKWSSDTYATRDGAFLQISTSKKRTLVVGRRYAGNYLTDSGYFDNFAGPWTIDGTVYPAVLSPSPLSDPFGRVYSSALTLHAVVRWSYGGGVPQRAVYNSGVTVALGEYYWVNFWIYSTAGGGYTVKSDVPGCADQGFSVVAATWTRVTLRFGPATAGGTTAKLIFDFASALPDAISLWGWQVVKPFGSGNNQYPGFSFGGPFPTLGSESGFVATPGLKVDLGSILRTDWDQPIPALYETAPFGQPVGRSTFGRVALRMIGSGQLTARWQLPDDAYRTFKATTQSELPLADPATNDLELQDNYNQTQLSLVFSTNAEGYYWSLCRLAAFSKPSTYDEFRR